MEKFNEDKHHPKQQKDWGNDCEKRVEILTITGPRPYTNRESWYPDAGPYRQNILNIAFLVNDPRPEPWDPNDTLHITGFVSQHSVEQVYIDNRTRVNMIYNYCLRQLQIKWKEYVQPPHRGPLVGITVHHVWLMGIVRLPFTLTSHDRAKEITRVLELSLVDLSTD